MIINNYFSTTDLALAGVISLFYSLDSLDKTNPLKAAFIFKSEDGLDSIVQAYWRKELQVEPQAYFFAIKTLKSRLYERT